MASANFSGDGRYRIDYTVSVVQQDVANNRTLIRRVLNMVKQSGSGDWSSSPVSYFSSTGPTTIGTSYFSFDFRGYSTLTLINTTQWVNHNADGTMGFTATAFVAADLSTGSPSSRQASVSFWVSLPTIPRATTPTMSGGFTTGVTSTIVLPRASTAFTHDVSWSIGTKSGSLGTGLATEATWNPPHSVLTELPNAASANVTITVVTKNGATVIGTRTAQFTLTAAASIVPTVSGVTWTDTNTTVATNIGAFVQGHSLLRGAVSASGVHGSTITSKSVIVGGQTLPENRVFTVSGSGTVTAQGQAIDSRGRTNTTPANFTVLPYSEPSIGANGWQVSRANASNVATNDGAYLRLDLHAIATGLTVGGVQKNSLTISVRTRPRNGSWTNRNTVTPGLTQNGAIQITGGAAFLTTQSYEVEVTITDKVITTPMVLKTTISTAIVTMDLNGNSVGIGKYHENGALDVQGDIYGADFYGNSMYSDGVKLARVDELETMPAGSIIAWPATTPPVNWLICNGQAVSRSTYSDLFAIIGTQFGSGNGSTTFNLPDLRGRVAVGYDSGQTEFNLIGKQGGEKSHTLTIAEMPSHGHTAGVLWHSGSTLAGSGGTAIYTVNTSTSVGTSAAGGGGAHNNLQPYTTVSYIIKASGGIDELSSTVESVLLGRLAAVESAVSTPPVFQAMLAANQSKSGASSWVKVNFTVKKMDLGGNYNTALSRFTAPKTGLYRFDADMVTTTTSGGPAYAFYVNGAMSPMGQMLGYSNSYMPAHLGEYIELAQGDYVELYWSNPNNSASTLTSAHGTRFYGKLVS